MRQFLLNFSRQVQEAFVIGKGFPVFSDRRFRKIIFFGVGGSAMSGEILRSVISEKTDLIFQVQRQPNWPRWVDQDTLAVFSSYSGNSAEVLDVFKKAKLPAGQMLAITSGGALRKKAFQRKIPCLIVPPGLPPRCALGFLTFSLLAIFQKILPLRLSDAEIRQTLQVIENKRWEKTAAGIARQLAGKAVFLYGVSGYFEPAILRWRAQLAENAKVLSSHYLFPELLHNEIEGWKKPSFLISRSAVIFFEDKQDPAVLKRKRKIAAAHIRRRGGKILWVKTQGRSPLSRLFSLIVLGDWVSCKLAEIYGVDPVAIPVIQSFKR